MTTLDVPLDGAFNARSVGAPERPWLYRSGSLDQLEPTGRARLLELGIGLVIDLRDDVERAAPGHDIPVAHHSIYQSPDGPPATGTLSAIYRMMLEEHGLQLTAAVMAIARSDSPVLVHCVAGKDRTGLVTALALGAAGFPEDYVVADYVQSGPLVRAAREESVAAQLADLGLEPSAYLAAARIQFDSPQEVLESALALVAERWGNAAGFLRAHGAEESDVRALRARLRQHPHQTILHISDIHATAGELLYGQVDGLQRLRRVADYVRDAGLTPEAIVITGDLVQVGHGVAYTSLREEFDRFEQLFGVPVLAALGNHDREDEARAILRPGELHYRSVELERMRIVVLDTSRGRLDDVQLEWLRKVLEHPHGDGTVLVMHHAPLGSPLPTLSRRGLANPEQLAAILSGTDVRLILAGHYHHPMGGSFQGIPVWVGPSLAYQQIMNAGPERVSGQDSAMFSIVQMRENDVVTAPVSLEPATPLFTVPANSATSAHHQKKELQ
jgi:Icc protein